MGDKAFVFDWQKEDRNSFLHWFLPTALSGTVLDDRMEELSEATDKFQNVTVQIIIGGVEVDAQPFLDNVELAIEHESTKHARRMLNEVGGLEALERRIGEVRSVLVAQVEEALAERGIELPSEDW